MGAATSRFAGPTCERLHCGYSVQRSHLWFALQVALLHRRRTLCRKQDLPHKLARREAQGTRVSFVRIEGFFDSATKPSRAYHGQSHPCGGGASSMTRKLHGKFESRLLPPETWPTSRSRRVLHSTVRGRPTSLFLGTNRTRHAFLLASSHWDVSY